MKKKTTLFLNISLTLVSLFCIFIFIIQMLCINIMGGNAIRDLGIFYMSGISEQVASHFGTVIELRLSQVESLVNSVPPGRATSETSMEIGLTYNARSAGFEYLALYTDDGNFHMLCGSQVIPDVPEVLHRSVQGGTYNVCAGKDAAETPVVLFGVPANYPMKDGSTSIALVAGLPASYLSDTLEDNVYSSIIEYSIIRDDGNYVLSSRITETQNYFERVKNLYETCNGKEPSQYAKELYAALQANKDYTSEVLISGEHWNIYCTNLPNSEWHLLLKISHNTLDETINLLQKKWSCISIGGCCLIICALLFVFAHYYRLAKLQMRELDEARKSAEQAKQSAERSNKAKNEFLSNMSHDIRTPMNGIMGMTAIAADNLDNPPRLRSCLKKIHISSRHLLGLITDMLDMAKIENGNLTLNKEPISLCEIMQNITTIIQPQILEKNQQFRIYAYEIHHENVYSDRVRLSQILLNILGNAVKFTQEGGVIEIDLYEEPSPKGNGYIRSHLYIKDNGIGISKEFQSKIFDAFAREDNARVAKAAGAGMGMTITKYIVDAMGGTISVESEPGKGSCFHISVDMEINAEPEQELCLPKHNILVIDQDEIAAKLAVLALNSIGLCAKAAPDYKQAVQMLENSQNENAPYHMLLLDRKQWECIGIQAFKDLSLTFSLPIILLTDGAWDESEVKREETGISGIVSKPLFCSGLYYNLRPFFETDTSQQQDKEDDIDLTGRRILIAEDNELNWEIASEMLGEFGLETEWAENGKICVEKFEQSPPAWYDAILMDLRMPVMTGFEATIAIRKSKHKDAETIPIIAVSADAFTDDIQKCLDHGMNAHLSKPLDLQKALDLLEQYLH